MKKKAKRKYVKSGKYSKQLCPVEKPKVVVPEVVAAPVGPILIKPKVVQAGIQMIHKNNFIAIAQRGAVIADDGDGFWAYKLPDGSGRMDEALPVWSTPPAAIPDWATHVAFFPKPKETDISYIKPAGNTQRWTASHEPK